MKDMNSNFGLLIAYALPGFVTLWGLSGIWPTAIECAMGANGCEALLSLVGFLNSTVAATATGMAVSAIRFVLIDSIHERSGLKRPKWNGVALQNNLAAVQTVVDQHYRYYQFHANMIVAVVLAYAAHLYHTRYLLGLLLVLVSALTTVFWIASRDNLKKYYENLDAIFHPQSKESLNMSNGMSHHHEDSKAGQKKVKAGDKPNNEQAQKKKPVKAEPPKAATN